MTGLPKFMLPTPQGLLLGDLFQKMLLGGASEVFIFTRFEFMALAQQALDGAWSATYYPAQTRTMSQTVLFAQQLENVKGANVLFGMPDTYFEADYRELLRVMDDGKMPAIAGCFRIRPDQWGKLGNVHINASGFIDKVVDKQTGPGIYPYFWGCLAWTPAFWKYIKPEQPHVGYALADAIAAGEYIGAYRFDGDYYDCGTREEYFRLCAKWHRESEAVTA